MLLIQLLKPTGCTPKLFDGFQPAAEHGHLGLFSKQFPWELLPLPGEVCPRRCRLAAQRPSLIWGQRGQGESFNLSNSQQL